MTPGDPGISSEELAISFAVVTGTRPGHPGDETEEHFWRSTPTWKDEIKAFKERNVALEIIHPELQQRWQPKLNIDE